jgi:DNA modification methylase
MASKKNFSTSHSSGDVLASHQVHIVNDHHFKWVQDASIDLILTDPPFNIARKTNFHTYEKNTINSFQFDDGKGWDSHTPHQFRQMLRDWSTEFYRVLRPGGSFAIFCADEYVSDLIFALRDAGLKPRRTVTWRKPNAVPVNRKHLMMSACEYIVVGVKGSKSTFNADFSTTHTSKYSLSESVNIADKIASILDIEIRRFLGDQVNRLEPNVLEPALQSLVSYHLPAALQRALKIYSDEQEGVQLCIPNYVMFNSKAGNRLHPTEKPVPLLRYLTELLSNPGDSVLDPFAGSGSTGEACVLTNRKVHLVERDLEFYEKAHHRLLALVDSLSPPLLDEI